LSHLGVRLDRIIDAISESGRPLSRKEIGVSLGWDPKNKSHMSSLSRFLRKLRERGLVIKDEESGPYSVPDDLDILVEKDREESGEFEAQKRQKERHKRDRISHGYLIDLRKAAREGRNLDEVAVPEGIPKSEAARILERQKETHLSVEGREVH
jgi:hypothetical protein